MKKIYSFFLLLGLLLSVGNAWATDVLTLDCATPAAESGSTAFSSTSDLATFLNSAAGLSTAENKIACSAKGGDVYNGKGSGGGNIPQKCLKIGKASGPGSFTFTIPNNYDEINEIEITCYGWKTSSSISINGGAAQTFTTAQVETTKTFELATATRTISISVTTSAVCVTEIVLKKSTAAVAKPTFTPVEGNYTSAQNVTIACATDGASIYYTLDGTEPTSNSTLYSSAISITETKTIKAIAKKDDAYSAVASATYSIYPVSHAGTQADPYTVADARNAIDAGGDLTNKYVSGIISQVDSYNDTYHSITYWISDDGTTTNQLQVYSGKGLNGADFSAKSDLQVNDEVIVTGTLKKYNSTYEFDLNNQLVSLNRPAAAPIINAENVNIAYNATSGEIAYTISNATEANLTAATSTDWISNINVTADKVTFTTTVNEDDLDRVGFITLSYTGAADKVVTITQAHYVIDYATLPFVWEGSASSASAELIAMEGVTASDLGSDYATSNAPYRVKLDGTGDYIQIKTDGAPGIVAIDVKMLGGSNTSTITVQASEDGETFDSGEELAISGAQNATMTLVTTRTFTSNVRYIKLLFTKGSNVGVGSIYVIKPVVLGANGYSTFSAKFKYTVSGASVYKAALNGEGDAIILTEVANAVVPSEIGIVLKGVEGAFVTIAPANTTASDFGGNQLVGVVRETPVEANWYVLATNLDGDGLTKFHNCQADVMIPANKAYIAIGEATAPGAIRIIENATDINNIEANEEAVKFIENGQLFIKKNGVIYNAVGAVVK